MLTLDEQLWLERILETSCSSALTPWEKTFINDVKIRYDELEGSMWLSSKQRGVLVRIENKLKI